MSEAKGPHLRIVSEDDGADRRLSTRVLVDLEVDCETEENYLFAYITDISSTGIFIRTNNPEPAGTRLNLRFAAGAVGNASNEDVSAQFELEGEVIWVNPLRPGQPDNLHPGMGVRFIGLGDDDRFRLQHVIRRMAYLPDTEEVPGQAPEGSSQGHDDLAGD